MAIIPCAPEKSQASVDTVELYFPRPKRGLRALIKDATGRRPHTESCGRWGVRAIFNRPTHDVLLGIHHIMAREPQCTVHRCDIALDFYMASEAEADALTAWIDKHVALKWRSAKARKTVFKTTVYSCDKTRGRNSALYRKRPHVVRLEMRFYRAGTARRAGLDDPGTIAAVNPKELFDHHFTARQFTERHKIKVMRQVAARERERQRTGRWHPVARAYSARAPRRALYVLDQIDAQSMGRVGTETLDLDFLRVPDHVAFL